MYSFQLESSHMASKIAPVWTTRKASVITRRASEQTLRTLYSEEFFIEEQHLDEDNKIEEQHALAVLPNHCVQVEPVFPGKRHDSIMSQARPTLVPRPIQDMQHVCRPYSAQPTTLLFDADVSCEDDEEELALYNDLYPEETAAPRPVQQQILEYSPTPELLDISDLKLQPSLATIPFRDHVSEMLNFEFFEAQETASGCVPKREGRPLVYPIPLYTVAEMDEQGNSSTQELTFPSSSGSPSLSDVDCHSVLYQMPARPFLPGLEHLTHIESRAAFISYGRDVEALGQASVEFLDDYHQFESPCLGDKVSNVMVPGENFLLASNDADYDLSLECPSAELLLSFIDELNDYEESSQIDARPASARLEPPHVVDAPRPGTIFDTGSSQFVGYTALDHAMGNFNTVSNSAHKQSVACEAVSDNSHDEVDELPMSQPSQLTYFDADSQQFVGYMAFNQLLMATDNDDSLSYIHREDEYPGFDDASLEAVREISELHVVNDTAVPQGLLHGPPLHSSVYEVDTCYGSHTGKTVARSVKTLQSFVRHRSSRRRPDFHVQTQLSVVDEDMPEDSQSLCSSASPDMTIDFADRRGFVKPTSARVANFLDDEDSDDDMERLQSSFLEDEASNDEWEVSQSVTPSISEIETSTSPAAPTPTSSSFSEASTAFTEIGRLQDDSWVDLELLQSSTNTSHPKLEPSISAPASPVSERFISLFDNEIWHENVALFIAMPLSPVSPHLPSADQFPPTDVLKSLETELYQLMASLFACLSSDRLAEALALGSDLQWTLSAITGVYPRLGLMQRLGTTVEILLQRVVALGRR